MLRTAQRMDALLSFNIFSLAYMGRPNTLTPILDRRQKQTRHMVPTQHTS